MFRVNIFNGELCLTMPDFYLPGPFPVSLEHSYSSNSNYLGPLGLGWDFPFDICLERVGTDLVLWKSGEELFRFNELERAHEPVEAALFVLHPFEHNGWRVKFKAEQLTFFFADGLKRMPALLAEDRQGNVIKLERNSNGQLVALTDPLAKRLDLVYRGKRLHRIVLSTHGSSKVDHIVLECGYDATGNLAWTSNNSRDRASYTYDNGKLVTYTNALGGTYCAQYNSEGKCVRVWEQHGAYSRHLSFDLKQLTTEVIDALGFRTLYRFDAQGMLIEKVDPLCGVIKYIRNEKGELISEINPVGQPSVLYHADSDKNRLTKIDVNGSTTVLEFDGNGEVIAVVDAAGGRWEYNRDQFGRMIGLCTPEANHWNFEYDLMGRFQKIRKPDDSTIEHRWSKDGCHYSLSDSLGTLAEKQFDSLGRIVSFHGLSGAAYSVRYEGLVNVIQNVDGSIRRYEEDAIGNLTRFVDELGSEWRLRYDRYGRLISTIDPTGYMMMWEYDGEGRVLSVSNESGERLENVRDSLGRIIKQRSFDGCERRYMYDSVGRLLSKVDGNGTVVSYEPDGSGRPLVRRYEDGCVVETEYKIGDHLLRATDDTGILEFEYDAEYRRTSERFGENEIHYEYDWNREPVRICFGVRDIRFDYDPRGEMHKITEGEEFKLTFDRDRNLQWDNATFHTGLCIRCIYDSRGRLTNQDVISRSGFLLFSKSFQYDSRNNRVEALRTGREPLSFSHNTRGELVQVRRAGQVIRDYTYDSSGNRIRINGTGYEYGPGNRLLRAGNRDFQYDEEGRPTIERQAGLDRSFRHDSRGRLIQVRSAGTTTFEFSYDYLFRRTTKTTEESKENTIWANDCVIEQRHSNGLCLEYIFHPTRRTPFAVRIGGEWHAIVSDQRGEMTDIVRLHDEMVVWSSDSLGFEWEVREGDQDLQVSLRGAGQMFDCETGLCYQRARFYDPSTGRFLLPDPLGIFGGFNFYRYCLNQPFLLTDPFGLVPCQLSKAECDALFQNIDRRAASVEKRWEDMHSPKKYDLPWDGTPPKGQPFMAAAVGALGTPWPAGATSMGSIDSHITAHADEQRGMQGVIQEYYEGHCGKFEDKTRQLAMVENTKIATMPPSLPHLGL